MHVTLALKASPRWLNDLSNITPTAKGPSRSGAQLQSQASRTQEPRVMQVGARGCLAEVEENGSQGKSLPTCSLSTVQTSLDPPMACPSVVLLFGKSGIHGTPTVGAHPQPWPSSVSPETTVLTIAYRPKEFAWHILTSGPLHWLSSDCKDLSPKSTLLKSSSASSLCSDATPAPGG